MENGIQVAYEGREAGRPMNDECEKKSKSVTGADYVPPRVVFHSREEILRTAGPAVGCARWSIIQQLGQKPPPDGDPA